MTLQRLASLLPLLVAALGPGCSPGSRDVACRALGSGRSPAAPNPAFRGTVFTIVMENHTAGDILGEDGPPYIQSLAHHYAVARGYRDALVHPSEPNYLWMVAGENFGVLSDGDPASNHVACTSHVADQLERAGLSWRAYQESMETPCNLVSRYPYEPKHDPFVYFDDLNGWNGQGFTIPPRCTEHVVDYSQFDRDLEAGALPRYVFITPDMLHDMHDGSVAQGDAWLAREVPKILASPAFTDGGVLFLTWDEGSVLGANDPPMIVISPHAKKGFVSQTPYSTSSYLKTVEMLLGVESLPCDPAPDQVPAMDDLFTVPLTAPN